MIPLCETCQYAKGRRKSTKGSVTSNKESTDGAIHDGHLRAGNLVSVDHFESRLKGRTYESYGAASADKYIGGWIFVDSMSSFLYVEHQLGFSSPETIRSKQTFERMALDHGMLINSYKADNVVFKVNEFVSNVRELNQKLSYCSLRAIRTVSECASTLMLYAACH